MTPNRHHSRVNGELSRIRQALSDTNVVLIKDSVTIDTKGNKDRAEKLYELLGNIMSDTKGLN